MVVSTGTFQHSPESFRYVEMRGIRRQEEKKESSLLPNLSHFLHKFAAMHLCIIQHDESLSLYREGKFIKEICYFFGCHAFHGCETMVVAPVVDHSPYVESLVSFRWDCHIFPWKLPSIRHVSFSACETSIPEKEVYESGVVLFYKALATSPSYKRRVAARVSLWSSSLYVQILRQG